MTTLTGRFARRLGALAVVVVALAVAATSAGAAPAFDRGPKLPKGPKIKVTKACSLLDRKQVALLFGARVGLSRTNAQSPITNDCAWIVHDAANDALVAGRLVGVLVYPGFTPPGANAVSVLEDDRANAQVGGSGVIDLPLGKAGFLYKPRSLVEVAPSKRFAFSLQWLPTGGPPEGGPVTPEIRSVLTTLATDVTKRAKRVG
jgi:hypothetical protein